MNNKFFSAVVALSLVAIAVALWQYPALRSHLWSEEAAGWAQAIGAVAAIWFAHRAGRKQAQDALQAVYKTDEIAAHRKFNSALAVADSALLYITEPGHYFTEQTLTSPVLLQEAYSAPLMQSLLDALSKIPVHDLGSYEAITAFLGLVRAMHDFRDGVEHALGRLFGRISFDPDTHYDQSKPFNSLARVNKHVSELHRLRHR